MKMQKDFMKNLALNLPRIDELHLYLLIKDLRQTLRQYKQPKIRSACLLKNIPRH